MTEPQDIRWQQRFENFSRALQALRRGVEMSQQRELNELEQQGLIQGFEYTHELAWKVFKDYLEEQGYVGIIGSKNATRDAFKDALIEDGQVWMDMIKARNETSHTYDTVLAEKIVHRILADFYPAFVKMEQRFQALSQQAP
jgi:nucleotidyltransferase substrate binding protein (TIGR01987 family)